MNIKFEIESKKAIKLEVQEISYSEISDNEENHDKLQKEHIQLFADYTQLKFVANAKNDECMEHIKQYNMQQKLIRVLQDDLQNLRKENRKLRNKINE